MPGPPIQFDRNRKGNTHAHPPHPERPDPKSTARRRKPKNAEGDQQVVAVKQAAQQLKGPPKRNKDAMLPDDDPLTLIDAIDATGGADGMRPRMTPTAAEAFRVLCSMAPILRTLPRLREKLRVDWGKSPNKKTLEVWSARYQWQELLRTYDQTLQRYRLWADEDRKKQATDRQIRIGRFMANNAVRQMEQMFNDADLARVNDSLTGAEENSSSSGGKTKKKAASLNGLHALAVTAAKGVEIERVALGMPTVVTSGNMVNENLNVTASGEMTLEEWRRRLEDERKGITPTDPITPLPALPAPIAALAQEEYDELPFEEDDGKTVEGSLVTQSAAESAQDAAVAAEEAPRS